MQLDLAHQLEQVNKEMDEMLMVDLQVWSVVYSSLFPDVDFTKAFFFFASFIDCIMLIASKYKWLEIAAIVD